MTFSNGDPVDVAFAGLILHGVYISGTNNNAIIKLSSGYNICVPENFCEPGAEIISPEKPAAVPLVQDANLPQLSIISTGGTIASTVDYRTGAVSSKFTAEDILRSIPELSKIAKFRTIQPFNVLSENVNPLMWQELSRAIYDEVRAGSTGIIVTHGTDTMLYSAAAVSFMLETPVPVIFAGAQRSADRPSSDNSMNTICAALAAVSDLGEVAVCMHATSSDTVCSLHRAVRVRKNHTSRRDAFQSVGRDPIGGVGYSDGTVVLTDDAVKRGTYELRLSDRLEPDCGLIQYYPGMNPAIFDAFDGYKGLVISGTGLGHVGTDCIPKITGLIKNGTVVVMTSQCQDGSVCDRVYETGRDLLHAGVIEGGNMLPEVALVKLMWVLGNAGRPEDVKRMMQENLKGELDNTIRGEF